MIALAMLALLASWQPCWSPLDHDLGWEGYEEGDVLPRGHLSEPGRMRLWPTGAAVCATWPEQFEV